MIMMVWWGTKKPHYSTLRNEHETEVWCMMEWAGENRIYSQLTGGIVWCIWEKRPLVGWVIADTEKNKFIGHKAKSRQQCKLDKVYQDLLFERILEAG